jgi:hypothetical protein
VLILFRHGSLFERAGRIAQSLSSLASSECRKKCSDATAGAVSVAVALTYLPQPMKPCVNLEWAKTGPEIGGKACALISS